ncbi:MAG: DUF805 domain-containing protein [Aquabacterium sp.]
MLASGTSHPPLADAWRESMTPAQLLLSRHGRIGRARWWAFGIGVPLAIFVIGHALMQIAGLDGSSAINGAVRLLALIPMVAVTAKRWHDLGRSAWWVALLVIPVLGLAWTALECGLRRGQPGDNRYGPQPAG